MSIFKTNSTPEEKWKIGTVKLIFHVFSKYLVIFWHSTLGKSWTLKPIFKEQKWTFWIQIFLLCALAPEKRMCSDSHRTYHLFLCQHNSKVLGLEQLPPTNDAAHTSMTPTNFLIFWNFKTFFDVFDDVISRSLDKWPQNYQYW